jgi:hypothetical protein
MAQHVEVTITDDIDNSPGAETVTFAFGRGGRVTQYDIDLSAKNATAFQKVLDKYIEHGRKVSAARQSRSRVRVNGTNGHDGTDTAAIRAWAATNSIKVSDRGRIAADVIAQYEAAHRDRT